MGEMSVIQSGGFPPLLRWSRCMRVGRAIFVTFLAAIFGWAQARDDRQSATTPPTATQGQSCMFDAQRGEVPDCLRADPSGVLFVANRYLAKISFDAHGLAAVWSPELGWMYVNRKGKVLITGVPAVDNWADSFHDGLVRFLKDKKYGFADRKGQIVIPASYDGAMAFENGQARVCRGCENKCAEASCEHHSFVGGEWMSVNTKGELQK
jgi:hypothetical protein